MNKEDKQFVDLFNTNIEVGDKIAFNPPKWKGLTTGTVTGFSKKMVQVEFLDTRYNKSRKTSVYAGDLVVDIINRVTKTWDTEPVVAVVSERDALIYGGAS